MRSTETVSNEKIAGGEGLSWRRLPLAVLLAAFAAAVANALVYLEVMHVVAWAVIVGLLTTVARREASA